MVLSAIAEFLRIKFIGVLLTSVAFLSDSRIDLTIREDTAFLSNDRKRLHVAFVFQGREHKITLPYNPYCIHSPEVEVFDKDGGFLGTHHVTCPGLYEFLVSDRVLGHFYSGNIGKVVVNDDDID